MDVILDVRDLRTHFFTPEGVVKAVDGVSYSVREGETMALVGEHVAEADVPAVDALMTALDAHRDAMESPATVD